MRGRNQVNPTLDRYLKDSFEVIRYVHDNLPVLERIAGRLTPVEDLVEFKNQVEHLYGHLAVLTEASQIILRISDAGFNLMTAPSVPAQRALLGLGSAALKNVEFFATAAEFAQLRNEFDDLVIYVDEVVASLDRFATKDELEEVKGNLQGLIDDFANTVQLGDLINNELEVVINGETFTGLASAFTDLYTKITELENGLIVEAGKITLLESRIVNQDGTIEGLATAQDSLTTTVSLIDDRLTATSQDVTDLNVSITNLDHDIHGSGGALDVLRTTVTQQGEDISVESERLTRLSAEVTGLDGSVSAHADALSSLTSTVNKNENDIEVISLDTVQLQSRLDLVDDELVAEATAREDLETRVEQNESGLLIQGENITEVRAALTGPGNLLPNSNFESEPLGWFVRQRGSGWITVAVTQNLDAETKLPEEVGALSVSVSGVPAGELGISSPRTPVEPNKSYILSGHLAAENCTVSLEWRALNADGSTVEFGVAGEVTNEGGGKSLADWPRVHARIDASHDVVLIEAQLWVRDANTASPKAWLVRPMLEEASLLQEDPSPWVPGASGLDQKYAQATEILRASLETVEGDITGIAERLTVLEVEIGDGIGEAIQDLTAQVSENKDGIAANADSVTKLTSRLGAITEWEIFIDEDTPQNSYLRLASEDENSLVFQRGITLVRFTTSGELSTSQHFDTFSGAGQRSALISALDSLGDEDYFVLVGQPNLGSKPEDLVEAFLRVGAHRFGAVVPSRAYVLLGRGGIGPGGGIEHFSRNSEDSLRVFFTLVRDAPKEIGGFSATADALSEISTSVEQNKDGITLLGQRTDSLETAINDPDTGLSSKASNTRVDTVETTLDEATGDLTALSETMSLLGVETPDGQGFILDQNTVHVTPSETVAQWRNSIQGEFDGQSSRIDDEVQARQDGDSALTTAVQTAQSTANNAATKAELSAAQDTLAAADQALAERIDVTEATMRGVATVVNPGFEDGDVGWASSNTGEGALPAGVSIPSNAANAYSGERYLQFLANDGSSRGIRNLAHFAARPGETIRLRMQTRTAGATNVGAQIRLGIREVKDDGTGTNRYPPWITSTGGTWLYPDGVIEGSVTLSAEAAFAYAFIYSQDLTQGSILCDSVEVSRSTLNDEDIRAYVATVDAASVGRDGALAESITVVGTQAANAESSATQALTAASNAASAVQQVALDLGDTQASVSELSEVTSSAVSGNAVVNPSFETDDGWLLTDSTVYMEDANAPTGNRILRMNVGSGHAISLSNVPVKTGQRIRLGGLMNPRGSVPNSDARLTLRIRRYAADGGFIAYTNVATFNRPGNYSWHPFEGIYTVPEGTAAVAFQLGTSNHTSGAFAIDDVYLEPASEGESKMMARHTVLLDVNGNVSGTVSENDGSRSVFSILANVFRVITSGNTGLEWQNGYLRAYAGAVQLIFGINFGASNNLCFWYGPNVGANNCTKSNATIWFDNAGSAYFGGTLSAGVLRNGAQSTQISSRASVETGVFGTNGNRKVVTFSLSYFNVGVTTSSSERPPTGNIAGNVVLERRRGGSGSWSQVSSMTASGSITHISESEGVIVRVRLGGSSTFTDNATGTADFEYRVRIINSSGQWPWINPLGSQGTQTLTVLSIEEP